MSIYIYIYAYIYIYIYFRWCSGEGHAVSLSVWVNSWIDSVRIWMSACAFSHILLHVCHALQLWIICTILFDFLSGLMHVCSWLLASEPHNLSGWMLWESRWLAYFFGFDFHLHWTICERFHHVSVSLFVTQLLMWLNQPTRLFASSSQTVKQKMNWSWKMETILELICQCLELVLPWRQEIDCGSLKDVDLKERWDMGWWPQLNGPRDRETACGEQEHCNCRQSLLWLWPWVECSSTNTVWCCETVHTDSWCML